MWVRLFGIIHGWGYGLFSLFACTSPTLSLYQSILTLLNVFHKILWCAIAIFDSTMFQGSVSAQSPPSKMVGHQLFLLQSNVLMQPLCSQQPACEIKSTKALMPWWWYVLCKRLLHADRQVLLLQVSKESSLVLIMLAQLQWPIQITTAKKEFGRVNRNLISEVHVHYYHMGLPMPMFGYCIICVQLYMACGADGSWHSTVSFSCFTLVAS